MIFRGIGIRLDSFGLYRPSESFVCKVRRLKQSKESAHGT